MPLVIQTYKGYKIFQITSTNYAISYMHSDNIWRRGFKSIRSCKLRITKATKLLKGV